MKIRGTTITTPIARHAVVDDTAVCKKPWSSKNTVDKLCPSFEESGSVVTCEPLEGYPLEIISRIPLEKSVSKITLHHEAEDEGTSVYTVDLPYSVSNGSYNWTTGELYTEDEGATQLSPKVITAFLGKNTFYSDCGDTTVIGRTDPNDYWKKKLAEQEAELAKLNQQYELIEEITLDEDVTSFSRNKDTHGVPYDFSRLRVMVNFAAATASASVIFQVKNTEGKNILYHSGSNATIGTGIRNSVLSVYNDCGLAAYNVACGTSTNSNNQVAMYTTPKGWWDEWLNVASLYIGTYVSSGTVKIPAGTNIRIYAVRG